MTQSNSSDSTSGAEHSAFRSAQSALARKPLPGPPWAWPGVAALAIAGVAYLVVGTSGEHAAVRAAPSPSTEIAQLEPANPAPANPAPAAATEPPVAAPSNPPAPPAVAPANDIAAAPPKAEAEPAKASDDAEQAVASTAVTKKKARGSASRNRKRSARAH